MNKFARIFLAVVLCGVASTHISPVRAQADTSPKTETKVENTAITGWTIGWSNKLSISAPGNLKSGGADWTKLPLGSRGWSAENADVRIEIVRGLASDFNAIRDAAYVRIGGNANDTRAKNVQLDTYASTRLELDKKVVIASKHGIYSWGIVVLPTTSADAQPSVSKIIRSLWLERVEEPEWKDREAGEAFQAELPYDLAPAVAEQPNSRIYRARWNDMHVATIIYTGGIKFEGTLSAQIEGYKKMAGGEVKVKQFKRQFGFLAKEDGLAAQLDFKQGDKPQRVYIIASVAGVRYAFTSLWLEPNNPLHLMAAHRILGTLRLGYTAYEPEYSRQTLKGDPISLETNTTFKASEGDEFMRTHSGNSGTTHVVSIENNPVIKPYAYELNDAGKMASNTILGNIFKSIGGKLAKVEVTRFAAGAFPARRVRFDAEVGKGKNQKWINGDSFIVLTAHRIYMPIYFTDLASNDVMSRIASTMSFDFAAPTGWKSTQAGRSTFQALLPTDAKPTTEKDSWKIEVVKDGVKLNIEEKASPFKDEIYISHDGFTTGEIADNYIETDVGSLNEVKRRVGWLGAPSEFHWSATSIGNSRGVVGWSTGTGAYGARDIVVLHNGTHQWICEVNWNPTDRKSCDTRDAILASLRCERPKIVVDDSEDDLEGWDWWF